MKLFKSHDWQITLIYAGRVPAMEFSVPVNSFIELELLTPLKATEQPRLKTTQYVPAFFFSVWMHFVYLRVCPRARICSVCVCAWSFELLYLPECVETQQLGTVDNAYWHISTWHLVYDQLLRSKLQCHGRCLWASPVNILKPLKYFSTCYDLLGAGHCVKALCHEWAPWDRYNRFCRRG